MRGWKLVVIGILLGVPSALAATQVHTFRADPSSCQVPISDCHLEHRGSLQIECQGASCVFILTMNATYQANLAQTSKVLRTYGRDWTGTIIPVCDVRSSALSVSCSGLAQMAENFPTTGCRTFEAIAESLEQPLSMASTSAARDVGIEHSSSTTMCVKRDSSGKVTVTNL